MRDRGGGRRARARRHPERRAARATVAVCGQVSAAPHRRPGSGTGTGPAAAPARRLRPPLGRSGAATPGSRSRSPTTVSRRSAYRRSRSTASRPSSGRGWRRARPSSATSARAAPSTGRSRSGRPTCTSRSRCSRRTRPALEALAEQARNGARAAAGRRGDLASGLLPARRPDGPRSASRTGSASPRSKEAASRRPTRRSGRSRPARSSSATPTRPASCRRCRRPRCSAATAPTSCSASCTPGSRPTGSTCTRRPRPARRRRCSARRWSDAGRAARRWRSRPERDDPQLGADPGRNNDFLYGDDPRGFKCPARRARPARQPTRRARPRRQRQRPPAPDDPARHQLRAAAARGRARGRRRGPRDRLRLRRRAPEAPVRVRQDPVAQRRHLHRRPAEKDPLVGPNDGSGSFTIPQRPIRRRLQELPPFVVTRGGEYCFAPGLRALRWLGELTDVTEGEHVATTPTRHRSLEERSTSDRRRSGEAEPDQPVLARLRRRRARRRDHLEPAARRQRDHHRDGRPADRDPRDDRGPHLRSGRDPHRRRYARVLGRQRPAPAQEHDQGGLAARSGRTSIAPSTRCGSCASRSSPP